MSGDCARVRRGRARARSARTRVHAHEHEAPRTGVSTDDREPASALTASTRRRPRARAQHVHVGVSVPWDVHDSPRERSPSNATFDPAARAIVADTIAQRSAQLPTSRSSARTRQQCPATRAQATASAMFWTMGFCMVCLPWCGVRRAWFEARTSSSRLTQFSRFAMHAGAQHSTRRSCSA